MTKSDRQGLDFIQLFLAENRGLSPSFREIANHMGFASIAAASQLVHRLVEQGHITIQKGRSRSIELVKKVEKDALVLTDDVNDLLNAVVFLHKVTRDDFANEAVRDAALRYLPIHRPDPLAPTTSPRAPTSPELAGSSIR